MSYGYRFAGDALADLRDLPAEVQEDVLDLLEELVDDPPPDYDDRPTEADIVSSSGGSVFVRGVWDHGQQTLVIIGVRPGG